jgi:hypothetical protein
VRTCVGWSATKTLAASCAATRRFGFTSVAFMLPDTSMASITASMRVGSMMMACGREMAKIMQAMPSSNSMAGTCARLRFSMSRQPVCAAAPETAAALPFSNSPRLA